MSTVNTRYPFYESYAKGEHTFPDSEVSAEKKAQESYVVEMAAAIYKKYLNDNTAISTSYANFISELRDYGRGQQDTNKYKNFLIGSSTDTDGVVSDIDGHWTNNRQAERKGWMNVLWDIVSPAMKIRNTIHGLFDEIDFDEIADAIDADSGAEAEDKKWRLWATTRAAIAREIEQMSAMAGLPVQKPDFIPEDLNELEMYEQAGGFKAAYSMALEKLLRHTADFSEWEKKLKEKILDDLVDLNYCFARSVFDDQDNKEKWEYVDPQELVIQWSKYEDFRDSEYAGQLKEIKVSQLRRGLSEKGYTEKDVKKIAESYCGALGNPNHKEWKDYNTKSSTGSWLYDDFKVFVFKFEWIDQNKIKKVKYTNKYGKVRFSEYDEEKNKKLGNREVLVSSTSPCLYNGTWVIGTQYAYEHGMSYWQPRSEANKVELTYKGVKLEGKSLTAQLLPIYDNIQIGWLKYQNSLSVVFEEGYAVDLGMLQNITDGDRTYSMEEAVKMWRETGVLPFRSTPVGQWYKGGSPLPVHKLPGGMGESLNQAIVRLSLQMKIIEDITGLSPVSLGASPDPNAPVGTTEKSLQATHNALKPLIRAMFSLKDQLANIAAIRIQQLVKYDKEAEGAYIRVVGRQDVKSLQLAMGNNVQYGIRLQARATQQERLQLMRAAELALNPGRNGVPAIKVSDYLYILERLQAKGNLKEIRLYLANSQKRAEKQNFEERQQLQQQQIQGMQQLEQQKAEQAKFFQDLKTRGEIAVDNNQHKNEMELKMMELNKSFVDDLERQRQQEVKQQNYAAG